MFNSNNCCSVPVVANLGYGNDGLFGFGSGGDSWIAILFLLGLCGFGGFGGLGRGGWGGVGSPVYQGTTTREEITYGFDMNDLKNGIRNIQNGLCDGFYAMNSSVKDGFYSANNTMTQGFAGLNSVITNGFTAAELARCNQQADLMAMLNQMNYNQQNCCCQTQRAIDGVNYNLATQSCATQRAIADAARDIIDNANANFRALHDENVAIQMAQKDERIADLTAALNKADLAASQCAQNAYLVNQLKPCPAPAYIVSNPYCSCGYNTCA